MNPRSDAPARSPSTHRSWLPAPGHRFRLPLALLLFVAFCLGAVSLPGCGGCWNDDTTTAAKKKKEEEKKKEDAKKKKKKKDEKPKPDFEDLRARTLPSNDPTLAQKTPDVRS